MKKSIFIIAMLVLGGIFALNTGCEEDPKESCEQDLFCENTVEVTACCTDGADCYYTYDGQNYPDTDQGLLDLIEALDCTTTKSASLEEANEDLVYRLQAMLEEARISSK